MRSRITVALFAVLLVVGIAGCSKKEQPAQTPAAAGQEAQQSPAAQPAAGQPGSTEAAPGAPAAAPVAEQAPPPPPPPPPIVIPAGKTVTVRMGEGLNSKSTQDGQTFTGTLANGIAVNGTGRDSGRRRRYRSRIRSEVGRQVQGRSHSRHPSDLDQRQRRAACT